MWKIKVSAFYVRYQEMKLLQKIQVAGGDFQYLQPEHQLVCSHLSKFNKVPKFKKFKIVKNIVLKQSEFENFRLDPSGRLSFLGRPLLNQLEYEQRYGRVISEHFVALFNRHSMQCYVCRFFKEPGSIRKRDKLTPTERCLMAKDIGQNYTNAMLMRKYSLGRTTVLTLKRQLRFPDTRPKSTRPSRFTSLSTIEIQRIRQMFVEQPRITPIEVKLLLQLNCHVSSIRRVIHVDGYSLFSANETLLVSSVNFQLKKRFAVMMRHVPQFEINKFVFIDEKTLRSNVVGPVRVYRQDRRGRPRRGSQARSASPAFRGRNRRFVFRRNAQTVCKVNLFGFIHRNGTGDLFIFDNKTNSDLFINYFEYSVIPSMIEHCGTDFTLVMDGAKFHDSNLTLEYLARLKIKILIWPPQAPEWNLIENIWAILQKRMNRLIFEEGIPNSTDQLTIMAFRAWHTIEADIIQRMFEGFHSRLEAFLEQFPAEELSAFDPHTA